MSNSISSSDIKKVASLANIPLKDEEIEPLVSGFIQTLIVVEQLNAVDVSSVEPTHHTTGLENVMREDVVDESRMFSQEQALQNAKRTNKGYFVVDQVIEQE